MKIFDNRGTLVQTFNRAPNGFLVATDYIHLTFGRSHLVYPALEDLRLTFEGAFAPLDRTPSPSEIASAVFNYGFLETDFDPNHSWNIFVESAEVSHVRTTSYRLFVPDGANTLTLLSLAVPFLLVLKRLVS
jgi:hypothetical protein